MHIVVYAMHFNAMYRKETNSLKSTHLWNHSLARFVFNKNTRTFFVNIFESQFAIVNANTIFFQVHYIANHHIEKNCAVIIWCVENCDFPYVLKPFSHKFCEVSQLRIETWTSRYNLFFVEKLKLEDQTHSNICKKTIFFSKIKHKNIGSASYAK